MSKILVDKEILEQTLEVLEWYAEYSEITHKAAWAATELSAALAQQAEPVMWQFKHYTETEWRDLVPRTGQSIEQALAEIRGYCGPKGKPYYEVRCLYAAPSQRKPI